MDSMTDQALLEAAIATLTGVCSAPACVVQLRDRTVLMLYLDARCFVALYPTGELEIQGLPAPRAARPRGGRPGPPSRLQQQIEAVATLPKARQQFVSQMLETVLAQATAQPTSQPTTR